MSKKMFSAEIKQFSSYDGVTRTAVEEGSNQGQFQEILESIKALRVDLELGEAPVVQEAVQEGSMDIVEFAQLKHELEQLSEVILDTRREIASLQSSASGQKIDAMSDQLGAVVGDTETATNSILEAVEIIENQNESLELNASTPAENEITEAISTAVMQIYEACNFQDITGQRISKVVGTLNFVDERIAKMIEIVGGEAELEAVEIIAQDVQLDDDIELNGPRVEGQEISQDEIDSLFD